MIVMTGALPLQCIEADLGHKVGLLNLCSRLFLIAELYLMKLAICSSHTFALTTESDTFFKNLSKAICELGKMSENLSIPF